MERKKKVFLLDFIYLTSFLVELREEVKSFRKEVRNEPYTPTNYTRGKRSSGARSSQSQYHYQPRTQFAKY